MVRVDGGWHEPDLGQDRAADLYTQRVRFVSESRVVSGAEVGVLIGHVARNVPPRRRAQTAGRVLDHHRRHPVRAVRVQLRQPHASEEHGLGSSDRGQGVDGLTSVEGDNATARQGLVGEVQAHQVAAEQQVPVLFEQSDPGTELFSIFVRDRGEIPFDAQMAEDRRGRPKVQVVHAAGGVRSARRDVGAHQLRRDQLGGPASYLLTLMWIDAVRDPDAVGPGQDPKIDPGTTRRHTTRSPAQGAPV